MLGQLSPEQDSLIGMTPSPKSQTHIVGPPVERSVNLTVSGAAPEVGLPTKSAHIPVDEEKSRSLRTIRSPERAITWLVPARLEPDQKVMVLPTSASFTGTISRGSSGFSPGPP